MKGDSAAGGETLLIFVFSLVLQVFKAITKISLLKNGTKKRSLQLGFERCKLVPSEIVVDVFYS